MNENLPNIFGTTELRLVVDNSLAADQVVLMSSPLSQGCTLRLSELRLVALIGGLLKHKEMLETKYPLLPIAGTVKTG